jgi:hypothetical protein
MKTRTAHLKKRGGKGFSIVMDTFSLIIELGQRG